LIYRNEEFLNNKRTLHNRRRIEDIPIIVSFSEGLLSKNEETSNIEASKVHIVITHIVGKIRTLSIGST